MKVTVCIPVYNVENLIERCLDSVVNQSYANLEIIVVNDCTPDNSMRIVKQYAQRDSRIKIINHENNQGLMMARKTGYLAATGEYLMFCDSDDSMPLDSIKTLVDVAVMSEADIVSGDHTYIDINDNHNVISSSLKYGSDKESVFKSLLKKELFHNLWAKLFKSSLFHDYSYISYQNFTNGEDACLFYQIVDHANSMVHINIPVYYYYQNLSSATHKPLSEQSLRSIVITNSIRVTICNKYTKLRKYLKRYVFMLYKNLEKIGYDNDSILTSLFSEYGLKQYTQIKYNWYCLSLKDYIKIYFFNR